MITGSPSDLPKVEPCEKMLKEMGIAGKVVVASAHRSPSKVREAVKKAEEDGVEVIIAAAGMSAHLPGVVASQTNLPVIGVPLDGGLLGGVDALFSIVQMPSGIPVAAVAVNGATNAAILAARILALKYHEVAERLDKYRQSLESGS